MENGEGGGRRRGGEREDGRAREGGREERMKRGVFLTFPAASASLFSADTFPPFASSTILYASCTCQM